MSKREEQFYCKVGQAVCSVTGAILFVTVPIAFCGLAQCICKIIL